MFALQAFLLHFCVLKFRIMSNIPTSESEDSLKTGSSVKGTGADGNAPSESEGSNSEPSSSLSKGANGNSDDKNENVKPKQSKKVRGKPSPALLQAKMNAKKRQEEKGMSNDPSPVILVAKDHLQPVRLFPQSAGNIYRKFSSVEEY